MKNYTLKLLDRQLVAKDTLALYLEKPKNFKFQPGQYIDLGILGRSDLDDFDKFRELSIGSSPSEDFVMVAFRVRESIFKNIVSGLPLGTQMEMIGPHGYFALPEETKNPVVFLAGGIGFVPFRSMILHAAEKNLRHKIYLFYSNNDLEDAAFLEELWQQEVRNPNFKLIPTLTAQNLNLPDWNGERGYIDEQMIKKYVSNFDQVTYYIAGSPDMVLDLRYMLVEMGIRPQNIRTESFSGY